MGLFLHEAELRATGAQPESAGRGKSCAKNVEAAIENASVICHYAVDDCRQEDGYA